MPRSSVRIALLVCLALAGVLRPVAAQEHLASIRGVVVDPALTGMPRVEVRATREETRESRRVRTDDRGRFTVPQLPPGTYRVEVEHPGYGPVLARIALVTNQEFRLDIELQPGRVLHATDVPAPFSPVDQSSPALNTFVDGRELTAIPLEAGNFLELALLAPGTVRAAGGALAINGARGGFNGFLLDGVANVDPRRNAPAVRPPVDGLREIQVLTSTYDATFGRNAGGQINVVTRSGTSRLTGSAYEFYRGGALSARNPFAPAHGPAPDYSRHQLGGSLGGPIVPKRTFFFADYEHTRLREGVTRIATVPTAAERMGDFPASTPAGRALAALYPMPNRDGAGGNYIASPLRRGDDDRLDVRVDNAFTGGARLTGRYSVGDSRRFEPFAGAGSALVPGYGAAMPRRARNAALSFTHAPRRSIANDVRFGYTGVVDGAAPQDTGRSGLLTGNGVTVVSVAGLSPLGSNVSRRHASDTFQLSDAATWARGTHLLKFGGEWYGVQQRAADGAEVLRLAAFEGRGPTGNAVADLLLGLPALTAAARFDATQTLRGASWGLFAQDNWRATEALTLTAGVRYEADAPAVDAGNRASLYDRSTGAMVRLGTAAVPRGGYAADRNNVAPRAGFSWVIDRERKNLLRGGYGVYFNQNGLAASEPIYLNPPYATLEVRARDTAALTIADAFSSGRLLPPSVIAYQRDLQTPWMEQWNVNVQHQVGQTRSLEVGYAGSRGHDLLAARSLEPTTPAIGAITLIESRASSRYNGLQVRYQERPAHGMSILASYTLGKSTDDASGLFATEADPNFPRQSLDPQADRARSSFDVRHRFSAAILRPLPIGSGSALLGTLGWVSDALRNIELELAASLATGRPFTVMLRPDAAGTARALQGFGGAGRPNVTGDAAVETPSPDRWFDTGAFSLPAAGTAGNSGRNILEGPGYGDVSLALVKRVYFLQQGTLELRAEAFNVLDRINYDLPDAVYGSPTFGRILSADSPRRVQLGVRVEF